MASYNHSSVAWHYKLVSSLLHGTNNRDTQNHVEKPSWHQYGHRGMTSPLNDISLSLSPTAARGAPEYASRASHGHAWNANLSNHGAHRARQPSPTKQRLSPDLWQTRVKTPTKPLFISALTTSPSVLARVLSASPSRQRGVSLKTVGRST